MLKLFRKISLTLYIIIVIIGCLYGLLQYLKLSGFKRALAELVEIETNGEYRLSIRDSDLDVFNLNFILHDVQVTRTDTTDHNGIQSVSIPYVQVKINSIESYLRRKQFDIRNMTIREPVVHIGAAKAEPHEQDQARVTEQFLKLYPPLESIFDRFTVHTLTILKGELDIPRHGKDMISVGLVDILFFDWTNRHSSDSARLQVLIGQQTLDLGNSNLKFSAIEYNFPAHQLVFRDFDFSSHESTSASWISVSGKDLLIKSLNYDELYKNHRYYVQKVELNDPTVQGRLRVKSESRNIDERDVVTRILKQIVGECSLDSTVIHHADLQLVLVSDKDSVNINLPRVDFLLNDFRVMNDTSSFQMGSMQIGVDSTEVSLNDELRIVCDRLLFDDQRNLTVSHARFFQSQKKSPFITCSELTLDQFNLLTFAFYKQIISQGVKIRKADFFMTNEIFAQIRQQRKTKKPGILEFEVPRGIFQNVNFYFTDQHQTLSLKNASGRVRNISKEPGDFLKMDIQQLDAHDVEFHNPQLKITSVANGLSYQPGIYSVEYVQGKYDSLEILVDRIKALSSDPILENDFTQWKSVHIGRINIQGQAPGIKKGNSGVVIFSKVFTTDIMRLDLSLGTDRLKAQGFAVKIDSVTSDYSLTDIGRVRGTFRNIDFSNKAFMVTSDSLRVVGNNCYVFHNLSAQVKDATISAPQLRANQILNENGIWRGDEITAVKLRVSAAGNLVTTDSVKLLTLSKEPNESPKVDLLEIFNPYIKISEDENEEAQPSWIAGIGKIKTTPGKLEYGEQRIDFGATESSFEHEPDIWTESLKTQADKYDLEISDLKVRRDKIEAKSFDLIPIVSKHQLIDVEYDLISGNFKNVSVSTAQDIFRSGRATNFSKISVDTFRLEVSRDKQMKDPEDVVKPFLLENVLRPPAGISVSKGEFKNGLVTYCEVAEQSGQRGCVEIHKVNAELNYNAAGLTATANGSIYNSGSVSLSYQSTDQEKFDLMVSVKNLDLTEINRIVAPLQVIQIKSGVLKDYKLSIVGDDEEAIGNAVMSYENLHIDFLKKGKPEKKSGLLTFLADIFLRNSRDRSRIQVKQPRIKSKSIFNYWVKSATNGALNAVRRGKRVKED